MAKLPDTIKYFVPRCGVPPVPAKAFRARKGRAPRRTRGKLPLDRVVYLS